MFSGVIENLLKKAKSEKPRVPPKDVPPKKVKDMKRSHKTKEK